MKITFKNDLKKTAVEIDVKCLPVKIPPAKAREIFFALCGDLDCGPLGEHGPQEVEIETFNLDPSVYLFKKEG